MRLLFTAPLFALTLFFVGCDDSVYDEQAEDVRDTTEEYAEDVETS